MATLPSEAAADPALAQALVAAGMDCARINCAHDDARAWARMIDNVRAAAAKLKVGVRVLMDLGGPKCRVVEVQAPQQIPAQGRRAGGAVGRHRGRRRRSHRVLDLVSAIVDQLAPGRAVSFDDGKATALVSRRRRDARCSK